MKNSTVKMATCYERHLEKYEGATPEDYVKFSRRTAQKVAISRNDTAICKLFNLHTIAHVNFLNAVLPDHVDLRNPNEIVDATTNPYELAKMWIMCNIEARDYTSTETIINENVFEIRKECFERWGDKNWLSDVSKKWFDDNAVQLDVKIEIINENNSMELTIDDIIEFVRKYKPGKYLNPQQELLQRIEEQFKAVCGFNLKDYYADHLIKCCEFVQPQVTETETVDF
jgi:hypothetical protein